MEMEGTTGGCDIRQEKVPKLEPLDGLAPT